MTSSPVATSICDYNSSTMDAPKSYKSLRFNTSWSAKRPSQLSRELNHDLDNNVSDGSDTARPTPSRQTSPPGDNLAETSASDVTRSRDAILQRALSSSSRLSHFLHPPAYDTDDDEKRIRLPPPDSTVRREHQVYYRTSWSSTPLSVYKSPTGTFMWPSSQPSLQMSHPPILYVDYKDAGSPGSDNDSDNYSVQSSLEGTPPPPARSSSSWARKRRPSTDVPSPELGSAIIEPLRKVRVSSGRLSDRHPPEDHNPSETDGGTKDVVYSRGHINYILNTTDDTRCDSPPVSSPELSQSIASGPPTLPPKTKASSTPAAPVAENWEVYARQVKRSDGSLAYQCLWTTKENNTSTTCLYTSKKQLVKRHVETTHLKVKRFICEICNKAFPQKTSLDIHRHGHTGDTPHVCIYNCGKAFKDPARRHRHHIEAHGYVPKQFKRKYKATVPNQEQSEYESLEPWCPLDSEDPHVVQ